jgi:hypothetical protein
MQNSKSSANEGPEHHTARWTRNGAVFNGVLAVTNIIVATLIAGQLYFLKRQVQDASAAAEAASKQADQSILISKQSLEEAQTSNRAQLRPWVSALVVENHNLVSDDLSTWEMSVKFENVGKTPAMNVDLYGALELHEFPLKSTTKINIVDATLDEPDMTNRVMLPGAVTNSSIGFRRGEVPKNMNGLRDSKLAVYAVGHVTYLDDAKRRHCTQYCVVYSYQAVTNHRAAPSNSLEGRLCDYLQNAD